MDTIPTAKLFPNETILDDDYPVYYGYSYVGNFGTTDCPEYKIICSEVTGTVDNLKRQLHITEIRRCEIVLRISAARDPQ